MNAETLVLMLDEYLMDIRAHMTNLVWRDFVTALRSTSDSVMPKRADLEAWADRMLLLLKRFDYTKGLLEGFRFFSEIHQRGQPISMRCPGPMVSEEQLVNRIQALITRATDLP